MSHKQEILEYMERWESKRFRSSEITFAEAAESLETDNPIVVAKPGPNHSRWIMKNNETGKVAVLVFAAIWKWGGDLETGNFVPAGKRAPDGIPSDRIQDTPSFKCELTYTFDTSVDGSIWNCLKIFEDHVSAQQDFNKGCRPRRAWQSGKSPTAREKYIISSKLFTRRTPFNSKLGGEVQVPYKVHPWISKAVKDFVEEKQVPNPERPKYYDFSDGVLRALEDTENPRFDRNDIIWVSCKLGFVVSGDSWWSEIIPMELIRVDKLPQVGVSRSDSSLYPALDTEDFTPLETGGRLELFDEPVRVSKRKEPDSDGLVPSSSKRRVHVKDEPEPEPQIDEQSPETSETAVRSTSRGKQARETRSSRS